jgi:hypothetical protein
MKRTMSDGIIQRPLFASTNTKTPRAVYCTGCFVKYKQPDLLLVTSATLQYNHCFTLNPKTEQ